MPVEIREVVIRAHVIGKDHPLTHSNTDIHRKDREYRELLVDLEDRIMKKIERQRER